MEKVLDASLPFLSIIFFVLYALFIFKQGKAHLLCVVACLFNCNGFVFIAPRWQSSTARASTQSCMAE